MGLCHCTPAGATQRDPVSKKSLKNSEAVTVEHQTKQGLEQWTQPFGPSLSPQGPGISASHAMRNPPQSLEPQITAL